MKIIDLSATLEANLPSDPPFMIPEIEYWDHRRGAENMITFFPGATLAQALHGGEDYELLFTSRAAVEGASRIGSIRKNVG